VRIISRKMNACGRKVAIAFFAALWFCVPPVSAAEKAGAPAMWQITDDDSNVVLFGTFHLLPPGTDWRTPAFDAAMASTATTMVEADVLSPEAQAKLVPLIQQHGLNPPGVTLSGILGEERAAQFAAVAKELNLPMEALDAMRPWLAMLTVTQTAYMKAGFDPSKGVEVVVLARAKEEGDTIGYLETAESQIIALASLDEAEMLKSMDVSMEELEAVEEIEKFVAEIREMLEAWRTGDVDEMERKVISDIRTEAPKAFELLFVERNRNWVEQIKTIMAGEGTYFIAVGAGHLVGEDSVIDMLGKAGYEPKRIQ
jgi:uncharacterized protein